MFSKQPAPELKGIATITVAGATPGLIDFEFNYMSRKAYQAELERLRRGEQSEAEFIARLVRGWNHGHPESLVTEPYSPAALGDLLDRFWQAGEEIIDAYRRAQAEGARKN